MTNYDILTYLLFALKYFFSFGSLKIKEREVKVPTILYKARIDTWNGTIGKTKLIYDIKLQTELVFYKCKNIS